MIISAGRGLALARIGLGAYFVSQAWDKTTKHWLVDGRRLVQTLQSSLPREEAFYRNFLQGTVLPNAPLFARLVTLGEWTVGLLLLFGFLTRLGALTGMWLLANYMLMKGFSNGAG